MIPHRMLDNEISNNGLRDRVTACRKRLRESRVMSRANASTDVEELFPEASPTAARTCNFSSRHATSDTVTFLSLEEEVGIT
jgi:hypothetical protein